MSAACAPWRPPRCPGRPGARFAGALVLVGLLAGLAPPAAGAADDPLDPRNCLYPLGPAAENGKFATFTTGSDPEWAIIDGSFAGATKTYLTVVPWNGTLYAVYDGRYRLGDGGPNGTGGSKHNVHVKAWTAKGWNSTVEYPSNPDAKNTTPEGNNLNPRAVAFKDKLWTVWSKESSFNFATQGVPIVLRSRDASGAWGPYIFATTPDNATNNQIPNFIVVGDRMLIVWVNYPVLDHVGDTVIQGRFFDGETLGPVFNISRSQDGLADNWFTLSTDGTRVAVAWVTTKLATVEPDLAPRFAVFDGTAWLPEVELWAHSVSLTYQAGAEFFEGKLYLTFDTTDPALSVQGDYDLFVRVAELPSLALSDPVALSNAQLPGDDITASMTVYGGRLQVVWVSGDDQIAAGPDLDLVLRTFDGSAWSEPRDLTAEERYQNDEQAADFLVHQGALHVYWITLNKPPGSTTKDQRVATLMVERGPRWWDGLAASYAFDAPPVDGAPASARVTLRNTAGAAVDSPWISARFANGSWVRLSGTGGIYSISFAYNASLVTPFQLLACGKPIPLTEEPQPPAAGPTPAPISMTTAVAVGLGAAAAVGLVFALSRRVKRREEG